MDVRDLLIKQINPALDTSRGSKSLDDMIMRVKGFLTKLELKNYLRRKYIRE